MKRSFDDIKEMVLKAFQNRSGAAQSNGMITYCEIEEIYDDMVIFEEGEKYFQADYSIDDAGLVTLANLKEVEEITTYKPVFSERREFDFSASSIEDDFVIREGKLFEAGDYPDKGVNFDEDDIKRAVLNFKPVPNDIEHTNTILDGKLGEVRSIWQVGKEIFGKVAIPKWLAGLNENEKIKVSLAFDEHKNIIGNALTLSPRISDAAIVNAFSTFVPSTKKDGSKSQRTVMKLKDAIKHFFGVENVDDLEQDVQVKEEIVEEVKEEKAEEPKVEPEADKAQEAQFKAIQAQFSVLAHQALGDKSFAFADEVIRAKKAIPAQRESIANLFSNAVKNDAGSELFFNTQTGKLIEGNHVESLRNFFNAAPSHNLVGESLSTYDFKAGDGLDDARKAQLLEMSSLGRSIKNTKE